MTTPTAEITRDGTLIITDAQGVSVTTEHATIGSARLEAINHFAGIAPIEGLIIHSIDPEYEPADLHIFPDRQVRPLEPIVIPNRPRSTPTVVLRPGETAAAFSGTKATPTSAPAQLGKRGFWNRATGGVFRFAPGAAEAALRESTLEIQRGLSDHKTTTFLNFKGGSGKTTNAWGVSSTLGRIRGGTVLAWDNHENRGTLADRGAQASHTLTARELLLAAQELDPTSLSNELSHYIRPQGNNRFDILASASLGSKKILVDDIGFNLLHNALRRFYRMLLVDTGAASNAKNWFESVKASDVLVLSTLATEDSAKAAFATLDTLHQLGFADKAKNAVVIINQTAQPNADRIARMLSLFAGVAREVVLIPFDPHLAEGEVIRWEEIATETKDAYVHATAAITRGMGL